MICQRPSLAEVQRAAELLRDVVVHTPLLPMRDTDRDVLLKLETFQPITSFKIRGVFHAVASMSDEERSRGLSTVSAGNTAQALAWCGRHFGVPARSVMPDTAPKAKIDAMRRYGGEPVLVPIEEVFRFLKEHLWEHEPYTFVHPWTDRRVHAGHGTLGLEILADCPDVDTVVVPVGGGGLLAGVGSALEAVKPDVRVIAVEPEGCPSLHESLRSGAPAAVDCHTICDGVAVPYITHEMFPLLASLVDDVVLVSEADVKAAVRRLALVDKVISEPSGALAATAALAATESYGRTVALVTGGSIDADKLVSILQQD